MSSYPPPHQPPYAAAPAAGPDTGLGLKAWMVLTAIGIGSFLGVAVACGGGVAVLGYYMQQGVSNLNYMSSGGLGSTVPNLNYTMNLPGNATAGQPFDIELTLENTGTSPVDLYSLQDYFGLQITASDPPWQSEQGDELIYNMTLQPSQPQVIKLTAETSNTGYHTLNIDANMDPSGFPYAEAYGSIQIDPAPTTP